MTAAISAAASVAHLRARRGAFRIALIPPDVLDALNDGLLETVNLNEFMAISLPRLARSVAGQIGLESRGERLVDTLAMLDAFKPMQRHRHVARALYDMTGAHAAPDVIAPGSQRTRAMSRAAGPRSGSVFPPCPWKRSCSRCDASPPIHTSACARSHGWRCAMR